MKDLISAWVRPAAAIAIASLGIAFSGTASADAIIYNTGDATTATVALGVKDLGHLNVITGDITSNASATGLAFKIDGLWQDATAPGCLCEGWGVAANGIGASANESNVTSGLALDSFASTSSTATSMTSMIDLPGLTVEHAYQASASSALFEAVVTITNGTGAAATDVRYTRAMDWDVPPTEFDEYVTIIGTGTTTDLLYSSDNGFANSNPLIARSTDIGSCGTTVDFTDCGPDDHGALFDFGFGDLAAGESKAFSIFYGAAASERSALAALGEVGAELYSFGQQSGDPTGGAPATFIFAFKGVGGTVIVPPPSTGVPAPGTLALFALGLLGLRRSMKKAA